MFILPGLGPMALILGRELPLAASAVPDGPDTEGLRLSDALSGGVRGAAVGARIGSSSWHSDHLRDTWVGPLLYKSADLRALRSARISKMIRPFLCSALCVQPVE